MKISIETPFVVELDRFETAAGTPIPNFQHHYKMDYGDVQARKASFKRQYLSAIPRTTNPTQVYNCHGFVFASGRTGIDHAPPIRTILRDDGYVSIDETDTLPGDVVLYVAEDGDVEHSAILVTLARDTKSKKSPVVVSKWGPFFEYVHDLHDCPYDSQNIEYWRINKDPPKPAGP